METDNKSVFYLSLTSAFFFIIIVVFLASLGNANDALLKEKEILTQAAFAELKVNIFFGIIMFFLTKIISVLEDIRNNQYSTKRENKNTNSDNEKIKENNIDEE